MIDTNCGVIHVNIVDCKSLFEGTCEIIKNLIVVFQSFKAYLLQHAHAIAFKKHSIGISQHSISYILNCYIPIAFHSKAHLILNRF